MEEGWHSSRLCCRHMYQLHHTIVLYSVINTCLSCQISSVFGVQQGHLHYGKSIPYRVISPHQIYGSTHLKELDMLGMLYLVAAVVLALRCPHNPLLVKKKVLHRPFCPCSAVPYPLCNT